MEISIEVIAQLMHDWLLDIDENAFSSGKGSCANVLNRWGGKSVALCIEYTICA